MVNVCYEKAKTELLSGNISACEDFFSKNGFDLELGYCKFLNGELLNAYKIFEKLGEQSPRAIWAKGIIDLFLKKEMFFPTYFQLRNFLEIDLDLFLSAKKPEYIDKMLEFTHFFNSINLECYKFVARFLMNNSYEELAYKYMEKGKHYFYQDPELHIMLANYFMKLGEQDKALTSVKTCLKLLPNYFPAKRLYSQITELQQNSCDTSR